MHVGAGVGGLLGSSFSMQTSISAVGRLEELPG